MKERKLPVIAQQIVLTMKDGRHISYVGPIQIDLDDEPSVEVVNATFVNLIPDTINNLAEPKRIVEPTPSETLKIADVKTKMESIPDIERVNGPVDK